MIFGKVVADWKVFVGKCSTKNGKLLLEMGSESSRERYFLAKVVDFLTF